MASSANSRQKKQYSSAQIRGMRLVARILKNARIQDGKSFREFAALISQQSDYRFNHSRVQAFESAGEVTDKRNGVTNTVNPVYLKAVQPFTPYPLRTLKELYDGEIIEFLEGASMLGQLITQKEDELGSTRFKTECKKLDLTEEEIIEAKKGNLLSGKVTIALSSLLKLPTDEIHLAAIAQLNSEIS